MSDGQNTGTTEFHKVTVNLIPKAWEAANTTAAHLGLSRTDVINRALQAYAFLEQVVADGGKIIVSRRGGSEVVKFL